MQRVHLPFVGIFSPYNQRYWKLLSEEDEERGMGRLLRLSAVKKLGVLEKLAAFKRRSYRLDCEQADTGDACQRA